MTSPVAHRIRLLAAHRPHHLVLTVRDDVPRLHRRRVRDIVLAVQDETARRYPGMSFSAGAAMPDHLHLIGQFAGPGKMISRAMQYFASRIAMRVNRAFGRKGQVFRERFFSRVLGTISELVRTIKYVGENPVKARLCRRPEDWPGSSAAAWLRGDNAPAWSYRGWMYRVLGFFTAPRATLAGILSGRTRPRAAGKFRQNRLRFGRPPPPGPSPRSPPPPAPGAPVTIATPRCATPGRARSHPRGPTGAGPHAMARPGRRVTGQPTGNRGRAPPPA